MSELTLAEILLTGRQADPDGITVIISRQVVEEASEELTRLQAENERVRKCIQNAFDAIKYEAYNDALSSLNEALNSES